LVTAGLAGCAECMISFQPESQPLPATNRKKGLSFLGRIGGKSVSKSTVKFHGLLEILKKQFPNETLPAMPNLMTKVAVSIFCGDVSFTLAYKEIQRLVEEFVDYNEIRVARISEMSLVLGGNTLHGAIWERCHLLQIVLRSLFKKLGHFNIELPSDETKTFDVKKYLSGLDILDRHKVNLLRIIAFDEPRIMIADKVVYTTAQAMDLLEKGMTRYDFVKNVLKELTPEESFELYCLMRAFRDECRSADGEFSPEFGQTHFNKLMGSDKSRRHSGSARTSSDKESRKSK
jgi:hypothetical protein